MVFKFRKLLTLRRDRSCAGPQIMSQPCKNMSNIVCGPVQDRPLRSADLLESNCQLAELELLELWPPLANYGSANRKDDKYPVHGKYPMPPLHPHEILHYLPVGKERLLLNQEDGNKL